MEEQELSQEQVEVDTEKFSYDGHEYGVHNSLKALRDLCTEFCVKGSGSDSTPPVKNSQRARV